MWEPRTNVTERFDARVAELGSILLSGGLCESEVPPSKSSSALRDIPAELLILNRFGIRFPFIRAAWRIASRYGIDGREVLLRANVISEEIWLESQLLLDQERKRSFDKAAQESMLLEQATNNLRQTLPDYSAHQTFTWPQLLVTGCALIALTYFVYTGHQTALFIGFLSASAFYAAVIFMRTLMLAWYDYRVIGSNLAVSTADSDLPIYSLLVPLYDEANQIEELTAHLAKLNWPKEKLDIKLICERDDPSTIAAIHNAQLPNFFETIVVPTAEPKTKPKALNYCLPLIRGEFVAVYDAEDRPHQNQLREAYTRFNNESPELACLQAPLLISNKRRNLLTGMFFIEYLTLFNGMLPVLAKWRLPIPLGGTSNHFKAEILKKVGAWDPYNVTEDADLGIRLFREGYRSSTISLPTLEEAPPLLWPWIKQRTRWIKGWMQTILVHNRNPMHLLSDLGLKNGIGFHLLLTSIVISSLMHPLFLSLTIYELMNLSEPNAQQVWIIGIGAFNLIAGYTTYGLFAIMVLRKHGHGKFALLLIFMPFYWLIISVAGWRALFHLVIKPHRWEKTPHGLEYQSGEHKL